MIARCVAWALLAGACVVGYQAVGHWRNPWSAVSGVAASPVLGMLPPASNGCGKECLK